MEYRLLGLSGSAVSALALGQTQRDRRISGGRF